MKKRNWYVVNDLGDIAGHDLNEDHARQGAREMQEREPEAGWEAMEKEEIEEADTHKYRAYDLLTEWMGRPRATVEDAQADADQHNDGCAKQGGYGSAIVVQRDKDGRCETMDGETVWPPYGMSCGAVRWR